MKNLFYFMLIFMFFLFAESNSACQINSEKRDYLDSTAIHSAVKLENIQVLKGLLSHGVSPNIFDDKGETPLMIACRSSNPNFEIISLLIDYGSNILIHSEPEFDTPISIALDSSDTKLIEYLLQKVTNEQLYAEGDINLLISLAVIQQKLDALKIFLKRRQFFPDTLKHGFLPLIDALERIDFVEKLPDEDIKKDTMMNKAIEIADYLIKNDLDINSNFVCNQVFGQALHSTMSLRLLLENNFDFCKFLFNHKGSKIPFIEEFINYIVERENSYILNDELISVNYERSKENYLNVFIQVVDKNRDCFLIDDSIYNHLLEKITLNNKILLFDIFIKMKLNNKTNKLNKKQLINTIKKKGHLTIIQKLNKIDFN